MNKYYFLIALLLISCQSSSSSKFSEENPGKIIFFGNSLTEGFQLQPHQAYPALIQEKINQNSYPYKVINAGESGDTTESAKLRLNSVLDQQVDIFILELGANDGIRGVQLDNVQRNIEFIIDQVKIKHPSAKIFLAEMKLPIILGWGYVRRFKKIFPKIAESKEVILIPYFLEDVFGDPDLNLSDGIHPNAEGYKIVANNVWEVLETHLK